MEAEHASGLFFQRNLPFIDSAEFMPFFLCILYLILGVDESIDSCSCQLHAPHTFTITATPALCDKKVEKDAVCAVYTKNENKVE